MFVLANYQKDNIGSIKSIDFLNYQLKNDILFKIIKI